MLNRQQKLNRLVEFGVTISQVADLDFLFEKILTEARVLLNADAGSIYLKDGPELIFSYTQNDTLQERLPAGKKLIYTSFRLPINNNSIAGFVANNGSTVNIPDVYKLSGNLPFTHDSHFDELAGYHTQSVLTIPMKTSQDEILGVLQLINSKNDDGKVVPFNSEDEPLVKHFALYAANAMERAQLTRTTIMRMIGMAELRDPKETGPHVNRVAAYAVELFENYAKKHNYSQKQIDRQRDVLRLAAMLHDVCKVAISDTILKKPARFTAEEFEIMKQHTVMGARLFGDSKSDFDVFSAQVALNHHEHWDGTGYPGHVDVQTGKPLPDRKTADGKAIPKREDEIPLFGRIVAIADVYDALSCKRVYKDAWSEEDVFNKISEDRGTHFDPELVDIFFSLTDVFKAIAQKYPDPQ
ncbi:MAG: HD domain-containing protein [Caldithrix sp.]|nr:HD domain-containing protein [Caldithrix sp.]